LSQRASGKAPIVAVLLVKFRPSVLESLNERHNKLATWLLGVPFPRMDRCAEPSFLHSSCEWQVERQQGHGEKAAGRTTTIRKPNVASDCKYLFCPTEAQMLLLPHLSARLKEKKKLEVEVEDNVKKNQLKDDNNNKNREIRFQVERICLSAHLWRTDRETNNVKKTPGYASINLGIL
jgi:hypothetical protein